MRRDQAFKKDVQLNSQRICILRRPQTTHVTLPALKTQEVSSDPKKPPMGSLGPMQL